MGCCLGTTLERSSVLVNTDYAKPSVRMCASGNQAGFNNFIDIGDSIVLYVDFGTKCKPMVRTEDHPMGGASAGNVWPGHRYPSDGHTQYEIKLAGLQSFLLNINPKDEDCTTFRAEAILLMTDEVLDNPGALVKFTVPYVYWDEQGKRQVGEVTEEDITEEKYKVYHHALWNELNGYNKGVRDEIRVRTERKLSERTYGSTLFRKRSSLYTDSLDGTSLKASAQAIGPDESTPLLVNQPAKRFWPDTWEMSCWRSCCDPVLRSQNWFARFFAMFFVTPLTNVTGLSLYYQLYLSEIFHTRFWTRLGHYVCMPLIVMMMLSFFAQWRFTGCYTFINTEVLVVNGALVLAVLLFLWYLTWGFIQGSCLMGFFMIIPMTVLYILANIIFQMSVKNSPGHPFSCHECWKHTAYLNGSVQYYSAFELVAFYYNPLLWVLVLGAGQALSHIFEPKIPPRVNQTAHWLSCSDTFKHNGCTKTLLLLCAQAIFGTVDELLASPRLLPLFILRVCYTLGYNKKQWKVIKTLVKKSIAFGDPALDYIGHGGAENLPKDSVIPKDEIRNVTDPEGKAIGSNIGELRGRLRELELTLTDEQKAILENPSVLRSSEVEVQQIDPCIQHYITVRHYVAKYELQLYGYGPFRTNREENEVKLDDTRMERDFPSEKNSSFQNFLRQVRFYLWMMEDEMIEQRAISACCQKEL